MKMNQSEPTGIDDVQGTDQNSTWHVDQKRSLHKAILRKQITAAYSRMIENTDFGIAT
jgi:hypothetical protein